jgi:hypothetical protein
VAVVGAPTSTNLRNLAKSVTQSNSEIAREARRALASGERARRSAIAGTVVIPRPQGYAAPVAGLGTRTTAAKGDAEERNAFNVFDRPSCRTSSRRPASASST